MFNSKISISFVPDKKKTMAVKKVKPELDTNTEDKIKNAARLVFHKKGFAATRTRDIAEEAGINLALLNYYFRSKEKLFDIIMLETLQGFLKSVGAAFNDESTSLEDKIEAIVAGYIDLLIVEPQIPLFIMSELRNNPNELLKNMNVKQLIINSALAKQYKQGVKDGRIAQPNMLHFIMNILGLTVFPFIASPMLKIIGDVTNDQFNAVMTERKKMIPLWIKATLKVK